MKLYVDLATLQLIEAPGFRNAVTSMRFKRGDAAELDVAFLTGGTTPAFLGDAEDVEIHFGVKVSGSYGGSYLAHSAVWTMPDPESLSPSYVCCPSFNTVELDEAMLVGETGELSSITLMGEISWTVGDGEPTSTRTFEIVVDNDVVRGSEINPTRATEGLPVTFLPASRVSPNATLSASAGSVEDDSLYTLSIGADCDSVILTVNAGGYTSTDPTVSVTTNDEDGNLAKTVTINAFSHRKFAITGTFANESNVAVNTALIGELSYAGYDNSGQCHLWTDNGTIVDYINYIACYGTPGESSTRNTWEIHGTDPDAGEWAFSSDMVAWPEEIDWTGYGMTNETGAPVPVASGTTAAELAAFVTAAESLDGLLTVELDGDGGGAAPSLSTTVLRNAAVASCPGQPLILGTVGGPLDQYYCTTFPTVWTKTLCRNTEAIADAGTTGAALLKSATPYAAFTALGGTTVTTEYTGNATISKPDGAKAFSFVLVGGGGGGAAGRKGAAGTVRCGGGGGAAGNVIVSPVIPIRAGDFSWPLPLVIETGGLGGTAPSSSNTDGGSGGTGGSTSFAGFVALGGGPGQGGTSSTGLGGTATGATMLVNGQIITGCAGGAASTSGGVGANGGSTTMLLPTGGAAGGGITSGNVSSSTAYGGTMGVTSVYVVAAGGNVCPVTRFGTARNGCPGGSQETILNSPLGAGGAGGSAQVNGTASQNGGQGGNGLAKITFYF